MSPVLQWLQLNFGAGNFRARRPGTSALRMLLRLTVAKLAGRFLRVWDPPQVLFSGYGREATDTDVKAREKSAVKLFATCQLWSVGPR